MWPHPLQRQCGFPDKHKLRIVVVTLFFVNGLHIVREISLPLHPHIESGINTLHAVLSTHRFGYSRSKPVLYWKAVPLNLPPVPASSAWLFSPGSCCRFLYISPASCFHGTCHCFFCRVCLTYVALIFTGATVTLGQWEEISTPKLQSSVG